MSVVQHTAIKALKATLTVLVCCLVLASAWADTSLTEEDRASFWDAFRADNEVRMVAIVSAEPHKFLSWANDLLTTAMIYAAGPATHTRPIWSGRERLTVLELTALALMIHELVEDASEPLSAWADTAHQIVAILRESTQGSDAELRVLRMEQADAIERLLTTLESSSSADMTSVNNKGNLAAIEERADAYFDAGDRVRSEGNIRKAREHYLKVIEIYGEAIIMHGRYPAAHAEISLAHQKLSRLAIYENDVSGMGQHLEEAVRQSRLAVDLNPETSSHWRSLATAQGGLAAYAAAMGNQRTRRELLQARLKSSTQAQKLAPGDRRTVASAAAAHGQLAELALSEARFSEAARHAQFASETYDRLVRDVPRQEGYQRGRFMAYLHMGIAKVRSGDDEEGRMLMAKSSSIAQQQLDLHGNVETRILLAMIEYERADAIIVTGGRVELAFPYVERACELSQGIVDPRLAELRSLCDMKP